LVFVLNISTFVKNKDMNTNYNAIYDFCKVRNNGVSTKNGTVDYPPRVKFIIELLEKLGIDYEMDTYQVGKYKDNNFHNIYLRGTSTRWFMAHHDVCNHNIDNANDNSASVINAIMLKNIRPDVNIALVDGEELPTMGLGSAHFSDRVNNGDFGTVEWVLNLELTGIGGKNFFIADMNNLLCDKIFDKFGCPPFNPPFSDATIMNSRGIMTTVINPLPLVERGFKITKLGALEDDGFKLGELIFADDIKKINLHYRDNDELEDDNIDKFMLEPFEISESDFDKMPSIEYMDTSILWRCHMAADTVDKIKTDDMKEFVEQVLTVIADI